MIAFTGLVLLGILAAASGIWAALLLLYAGPQNSGLNTALAVAAAVMSLLTLASLFIRRWRWRMLTAHFTMFGLLLAWWATLAPSNDREWQPDLARLAHATIDGDRVTVHNIRNVDYRSEFDYTLAWYDKSFDLRKLEGVDLVAVYWMGPAIAHILSVLLLPVETIWQFPSRPGKKKVRAIQPSRASFANTNSITWWPTSAMSSACALTIGKTRPRMCMFTGCGVRLITVAGCLRHI